MAIFSSFSVGGGGGEGFAVAIVALYFKFARMLVGESLS